MEFIGTLAEAKSESHSDEEIVERVKGGEVALYEIIMRRYNQRLYRVARAVLRDDAEAEDVMQDAYVRAYQHLDQFAGRSLFSTWLTRIALHEALSRLRLRNRNQQFDDTGRDGESSMNNMAESSPDPEQNASRAELSHLLEEALLGLPEQFRTVVMLRDVEGMSTAETASALDLTEDNVKIRLIGGAPWLGDGLLSAWARKAKDAFPFMGDRCDRVVLDVLARLAELCGGGPSQIQ